MSRKGQSITLSISERDKAELKAIALELGMKWGESANISKLVEAIARRELSIAANNDWLPVRIEALVASVRALTDAGQIENAQAIANLLLERSELSLPIRKEIERFQENLPLPWRKDIDRYIRRQQPFQLSYQDAAGRLWSFTVRHAKISIHEGTQYIDCWCQETEGNQDIPELVHNWSLRLDRIPEAAVMPVDGEWRFNLAQIEVEMHLLGGLAFAYKAKKLEESANDWLAERSKIRRVVRRVSSTFWFIREVMQYAPDCKVVSPDSVREKVKQKLRLSCQQYDLEIQTEE